MMAAPADGLPLLTNAGATFSADRTYRYHLWRSWGAGYRVLFVMLNPSTADEHVLDPTLRRCSGFAQAWGFHGFEVVNLFGLKSTDPDALRAPGVDPVGPDNDRTILEVATSPRVDLIVCAWGKHGRQLERDRRVLTMLRGQGLLLTALGFNKDGTPVHPLYQSAHLNPVEFKPAGFLGVSE